MVLESKKLIKGRYLKDGGKTIIKNNKVYDYVIS